MTTEPSSIATPRGLRRFASTGTVATVLAVIPIWVAALRAGFNQIPPIGDAALTVLRSGDVFSSHLPLVGMVAAGASGGGHQVYFPGPWELYVLAGPTWLFGSVWGPVLAMAALNTVWVVIACRMLRRRLDTDRTGALVGIGFLVVFLWSIGSGMLITPVPMDMVTIPFVTFLIAAWCVADGDVDAIPALAIVANFLWLSHLVLIMLVPVIGVCAVVGLVLARRRGRDQDSPPQRRRPLRRPLITAGVITVVMWIPPIIDQIRSNPGNLGELLNSSGQARASVGSWATAVHVLIEVIGRPPFWFRGTLGNPSYTGKPIGPEVIGAITLFDIVVGVIIIGLVVTLGVFSLRRRDRTATWALIVATVAAFASIPNIYLAPTALDVFPFVYLRSLHGVAMFVWFAVALATWRLIRARVARPEWSIEPIRWGLVGCIAVVTLANVPTGDKGYGTDAREAQLVREMNAGVVAELADTGPVHLRSGWDLPSQIYFASLALGLADGGISFCMPGEMGPQLGRSCTDNQARTVTVMTTDAAGPERPNTLWSGDNLDPDERAEIERLDQLWDEGLEGRDELVLTNEATEMVEDKLSPAQQELLAALLAPADGNVVGVQKMFLVRSLVGSVIVSHGGRGVSPFVDPPLDGAALVRWRDLADDDVTVVVLDGIPG